MAASKVAVAFDQAEKSASEAEARQAPEEEPYKFKYEARSILEEALKAVQSAECDVKTWPVDQQAMCSRLQLRIGINFIDTEENTSGDKTIGGSLKTALPSLAQLLGEVRSSAGDAPLPLRCAVIALATDIVRACGHRSLILTGWSRPRAALKHLRLAKRVHSEVLSVATSPEASAAAALTTTSASRTAPDDQSAPRGGEKGSAAADRLHELVLAFEAAYTHTTFYYAQVYASMHETSVASRYVRVTLERQLIGYSAPNPGHETAGGEAGAADDSTDPAKPKETKEAASGAGAAVDEESVDLASGTPVHEPIGDSVDRVEWSRNAIRLCDFYKARRWWQHAARCLDAAECMLRHHRQQRVSEVRRATASASAEGVLPEKVDVGDRARRVEAEVSLYRGRLLLEVLDTARQRDISEEIKTDRLGPAGLNGMLYKRRRRMAIPCPLAEAAATVRSRSDMPLHPTADGEEAPKASTDDEDDDFDVDIGDSESDTEDEVESPSDSGQAGETGGKSLASSAPSSGAGADESKIGDGEELLAPSEVALPFASFMKECVEIASSSPGQAVVPSLDPGHTTPGDVTSFPRARAVFKRANAYFAQALMYFKLDGFVTDFVRIQEDKSGLYRCLVGFESTPQRAQAMQMRRVGLQAGLLGVLNPSIFVVNHKELSHQCAMAAREAAEIRLQIVDSAFEAKKTAPSPGELRSLCKVVDRALFFHLHFMRCFEDKRLPDGGPPVPRCLSERPDLAADIMRESTMAKEQPDIGKDGGYAGGSQEKPLVGATEIDSGTTMAYLNAAFVVAHLLNKRLDPMAMGRVRDCVDAQAAFQWVCDNSKHLLEQAGLSTDDPSVDRRVVGSDRFSQEVEVSAEMARLLTVKAERLRQQLRAASIRCDY